MLVLGRKGDRHGSVMAGKLHHHNLLVDGLTYYAITQEKIYLKLDLLGNANQHNMTKIANGNQ